MPTENIAPSSIVTDLDRYRQDLSLDDLVASITRYGIIQPLIIDDNNVLVDGGRRLAAALHLNIPLVPVVRQGNIPESLRRELELESNMRRKDFTWQEQVKGVCIVHKTHLREARLTGGDWTLEMTGAILGGYAASFVHYCMKLEPVLQDKLFEHCQTVTEASRLLYRQKADEAMAELSKRVQSRQEVVGHLDPNPSQETLSQLVKDGITIKDDGTLLAPKSTPTVDISKFVLLGDCLHVLETLPESSVDHVITDPPYAIDMDMVQQDNIGHSLGDVGRIEDTHTTEASLDVLEHIWPRLDRVLKPSGYVIMWCDMEYWSWLCEMAEASGFIVQRWPFVWCKSSICKNGAPHYNLTKNFEIALVARRRNATLPKPVTSSWIIAPNDAERLSNIFAKPFDVWRRLIESVSLVGQTILDPFAGEGSCPLAALKLNRNIIAIEKEERHYNYLLASISHHYGL